jgi:uncharacterized protein (TIRG00374 family)
MIISAYQMRMLVMSVIVTVVGYGIITFWAGYRPILDSFVTIGIYGAMSIFGLSFLNYLFRFWRWHRYIHLTQETHIPIIRHLIIYISGFALTTTPAKAGEAIRGVFLKDYGVGFKTNLACFLTERLSDLLAMIFLCLVGASKSHDYYSAVVIGFMLIAMIFLLIIYPQMIIRMQKFFKPNAKIWNALKHIYDVLLLTKIYHKPVILCQSLIISILAWSCEAYGFYYMIHLLGYDISLSHAIFIYAISMLIGGISFIPAGLGSSEVVMIALLLSSNVPLAVATAMTIFMRIATLWFAVLVGLVCLIIQSYGYRHKKTE